MLLFALFLLPHPQFFSTPHVTLPFTLIVFSLFLSHTPVTATLFSLFSLLFHPPPFRFSVFPYQLNGKAVSRWYQTHCLPHVLYHVFPSCFQPRVPKQPPAIPTPRVVAPPGPPEPTKGAAFTKVSRYAWVPGSIFLFSFKKMKIMKKKERTLFFFNHPCVLILAAQPVPIFIAKRGIDVDAVFDK